MNVPGRESPMNPPMRAGMSRWRRPVAMVLVAGGLAGLLWLKLRIVSGLPKTAYAVPKAQPNESGHGTVGAGPWRAPSSDQPR
jgi:hypothetical protein